MTQPAVMFAAGASDAHPVRRRCVPTRSKVVCRRRDQRLGRPPWSQNVSPRGDKSHVENRQGRRARCRCWLHHLSASRWRLHCCGAYTQPTSAPLTQAYQVAKADTKAPGGSLPSVGPRSIARAEGPARPSPAMRVSALRVAIVAASVCAPCDRRSCTAFASSMGSECSIRHSGWQPRGSPNLLSFVLL
jgi:hypothetical protein